MRNGFFLLELIVVMLCLSCSQGSNPISVEPSGQQNNETKIYQQMTDVSETAPLPFGVFGFWKAVVDLDSMTAELIPARSASAVGNIFDSDLSQFLNVAPCINCMSVAKMFIDGYGNLNLTVRMKHPFANLAKRPDLHGFDVRAIFIVPADKTDPNIKVMGTDGVERDANFTLDYILNADGYTSHYDELPSDPRYFLGGADVVGNLNPFLRFFEDYTTPVFNPHEPSGHNVMPVGSGTYDRTAVFNINKLTSNFGFYIVADVAYGQSATLANRTNPLYFLPAFHRTEAWRAEYWLENNNLSSWDDTSTADVVVQVFDWQQGGIVDPSYPNPTNLLGIPEKSDVLRLELSIPDMQDAPVVVTTPEIGYGTPTNPLRYRLKVTNQKRAGAPAVGLLAIRDDLYGMASPHGRMPVPESPAGFPYATNDIRDYSLYIPIIVKMKYSYYEKNNYSSFDYKSLFIPMTDQFARKSGSTYSTVIHPEFFQDPSHKKFQYRWDYDYDGVTFDVDGGGAPSPTIVFSTPGKKNIGLRIRDNAVPPNEYIFEIPVYAEGEAFNINIPSSDLNKDKPSERRNQAIEATSQNLYIAYEHELGTNRNIWLAIIDRRGTITTKQITNVTGVCYDPALEVITYDTHAGVYIVYSKKDGSNAYLYSTYGNLDGSGFIPAHEKKVTSDTNCREYQACIIDDFGRMNVIYSKETAGKMHICGAYSEDYFQSWNTYGRVANNGSTIQCNPAACATSYHKSIIIYQDYINEVATGSDLYMVDVDNGRFFRTPKNISVFHDTTKEINPSVDANSMWQIAIAYLAEYPSEPVRKARLKILHPTADSQFDFAIDYDTGYGTTHTTPCVSSAANHNYTYAFGSYNESTDELTAHVLHLSAYSTVNKLDCEVLFEQTVGTISDFYGQSIIPAVYCRSPLNCTIENFIVFRNFLTGSYISPIQPNAVFGQISVLYIVDENQEP